MNTITERDYNSQIKAIVRDLKQEYRNAGGADDPNDWLCEHIHNTVDGHEWIIYTYYNSQVLTHSPNEGAYFDSMGELKSDSYGDAVGKMAFEAMRQDIWDEIDMDDFPEAE